MKKAQKIIIICILLLAIAFASAFIARKVVFFTPNTTHATLVIPKHATFDQVLDSLAKNNIVNNIKTFKIASKILKYDRYVMRGRYEIKADETNYQLIRKLRKGQRYPVTFTFNNVRTLPDFLQRTEEKFLFSTQELQKLLENENFLTSIGFTRETLPALFIPDTYQIYYDIDADEFVEKFLSIYHNFWNDKRLEQANAISLTPIEVAILASIVEEENHKEFEKPIIAGVYINRLRKGMRLQADPTVKFAVGDVTMQRILFKHLETDSPYNTYMYAGLPPGPIRLPAPSTIDSVLQYTKHNYLYMCAKEDFSGAHNFAVTLAEHERNATKYRNALNKLKIKR
ncbi:MAG: endolytic transglycosylase MltG [Bacteroidetes bacterium]|nr:endolytic transglycosylase MltG [Bacteroidota bacterium]MCL2303399.1 endolytic transglycosylase MltG [Lentimicrobiaceae bacterium]